MLSVYDSCPLVDKIRMVCHLVPWLFSLFWAQCSPAQLNPFCHPFYPDITHIRKDTRPSPYLLMRLYEPLSLAEVSCCNSFSALVQLKVTMSLAEWKAGKWLSE